MKVFKVELLIVDFDNVGAEGIKDEIENANYGNDCISPNVMHMDEREIEWSDEHPLNKYGTMKSAYQELFSNAVKAK